MYGSGRSSQKHSKGVCEIGCCVEDEVDDVREGDGDEDGVDEDGDDMDVDDRSVVMASANFRLPSSLRCKKSVW